MRAHGLHEFTKDMLLKMVRDDNARVSAYEYKGRCWRMDSVQSYFRFNMDILDTADPQGSCSPCPYTPRCATRCPPTTATT